MGEAAAMLVEARHLVGKSVSDRALTSIGGRTCRGMDHDMTGQALRHGRLLVNDKTDAE